MADRPEELAGARASGGSVGWWRAALNVRTGELGAVVLSGLQHFCLLGGYFCLRPVREAMGVQRSFYDLYWLFGCTLVVMLSASVAFAWLTKRTPRRVFIPVSYGFFMLNLLGFAALLWSSSGEMAVWVGWVFFVWLSVFNMFVLSVFWSFMADGFALEQSKRVYPMVAVGGTLGALGGGVYASEMIGAIGPTGMMLSGFGMLGLALVCFALLDRRWFGLARDPNPATPAVVDAERPIGGGVLSGLTHIAGSRYLSGIAGYILLMTIASTFLYFTKSRLVVDTSDDLAERVRLFAHIDVLTQALTLVTQAFITGRLLRWIGVGRVLAIAPVVVGIGFAVLAVWPVYAVVAVFDAVYRTTRHAFARPARETLFTVVTREDKYRAKNVIDTVVYRGGDVVGMGAHAGIAATTLGVVGLASAAAPMAVVWIFLGLYLGLSQRRLGLEDEARTSLQPQASAT
ncbi:MAG: MFS transporter [Planctomycetota bacterium]